jgi:MMPL family
VTSGILPDGSTDLLVTAKAGPYTPAARALVSRLRTGPLHAVLGGVPYRVGGETADSIDATQAMFSGLPKVGLALLVIIALMLLFALRSVFLPVKAVVLVILSLGASLGSLLLLVTTRLGATLIGAPGPEDIHPIVPITIVAITVALSTDYEVILLSRIAVFAGFALAGRERPGATPMDGPAAARPSGRRVRSSWFLSGWGCQVAASASRAPGMISAVRREPAASHTEPSHSAASGWPSVRSTTTLVPRA